MEKFSILTHQPVRIGDAARALAEADVVVTEEYHIPFIEHAYLEPEAAVAEPDGKGGINLWCGVQNQFQTLRQIANALALPIEQINMINLPMGGAFGGKCDITVQVMVALGTLVTGRAVKMTLTRAESLRAHPKRHAFATQVAIVAVDEQTGRVEPLKMIAAHDVGRAIHPHNIEGQLQGACAMGLGTALWERFRLRNGWNITNSLRRTLIPDPCRIPEIIPVIVKDDEPSGLYGAKGIAEIAAIPSAAAVVNAITDAIGVEFREIPVTRGKICKELA